jgi:hypothetical protein
MLLFVVVASGKSLVYVHKRNRTQQLLGGGFFPLGFPQTVLDSQSEGLYRPGKVSVTGSRPRKIEAVRDLSRDAGAKRLDAAVPQKISCWWREVPSAHAMQENQIRRPVSFGQSNCSYGRVQEPSTRIGLP